MAEPTDETAWWLRVMGHTYKTIAERLDLPSPREAKAAVQRAAHEMERRI